MSANSCKRLQQPNNLISINQMAASVESVAQRAGVSVSTVSRALRSVPGVSSATRKRVREAAEDLGYTVSPAASRLATGRTMTVAVVVPEVAKWFFGRVIGTATQALQGAGYDVLLYELATPDQRSSFFAAPDLHGRTDGVLIMALQPTAAELESLARQGQTVSLLGSTAPGAASVCVDDVEAGRLAARHLLNLGHERIAFIGIDNGADSTLGDVPPAQRLLGYREALAEAGVLPDPSIERFTVNSIAGGELAASALLSAGLPPTAVVAASDELAFGTLKVLRQAGLSVPADFSVVGFDNHEFCDVVGLTTLDHDVARQGSTAARLLLAALDGGDPQPVRVPARLVVRSSTAPPRMLRSSPS